MENFWHALGRFMTEVSFLEEVKAKVPSGTSDPKEEVRQFTEAVNATGKHRFSRFEIHEMIRLVKRPDCLAALTALRALVQGRLGLGKYSDEAQKLSGLLCSDTKLRAALGSSGNPADFHFDLSEPDDPKLLALLLGDAGAREALDVIEASWSGSCAPSLTFARGYEHCRQGTVKA